MAWLRWAPLAVMAALASPSLATPPLQAYGALSAIERVVLSPSGDRIALVVTNGGRRKIVVMTADRKPVAIAPLEGSPVTQIEWAGEDHLVLVAPATLVGRNGRSDQRYNRAFHVDLTTRETSVIFARESFYVPVILGLYGVWEKDGVPMAYAGGAPVNLIATDIDGVVHPNLYAIDLQSGRETPLDGAQNGSRRWAVSPDGAITGYSHYLFRDKTWRLYRGVGEGDLVMERAVDGEQGAALLGVGRTAGSLLAHDFSGGGNRVLEFSQGRSAGETLLTDETLAWPLVDRKTGLLLGFNLGDTRTVLYSPELKRRFEATAKAFPGLRVVLASYSQGFDRIVVFTDGPGDSGTYWMIDISTGQAKVLGETRPAVGSGDVGPMRLVRYQAADGLLMDGLLTLPPGASATNLPLVVIPHDDVMDPAADGGFNWIAQAFASRGYAVFQPNNRGTLRRGEAFRLAAAGELGGKMQTDISDGVAALAAEGLIDARRVCILGEGYGGYAALAGVTLQKGVYRCAVSINGFSSVASQVMEFGDNNGHDKRGLQFWRDVSGASDKKGADAISPVSHSDRADAPILLIRGDREPLDPVWESRNMERALNKAGKPVETVVIKGQDYWAWQEATRMQTLAAAVAFVEKNNPAR